MGKFKNLCLLINYRTKGYFFSTTTFYLRLVHLPCKFRSVIYISFTFFQGKVGKPNVGNLGANAFKMKIQANKKKQENEKLKKQKSANRQIR